MCGGLGLVIAGLHSFLGGCGGCLVRSFVGPFLAGWVLFRVSVASAALVVGVPVGIYGEFDSGSGRTLAACLTHASRTVIQGLASGDQWRTGE